MVDVLDARLSKWGSVFRYGLTTLLPWRYSCLVMFEDLGDFDGEIFGTELTTFGDHVLFVGLGLLLTCFTFRVSFCLFALFDFSNTASDAHVSTPSRALRSIVQSGSCICFDLPLFAVFDDQDILISIGLVDDYDMIETAITMICSWLLCVGCRVGRTSTSKASITLMSFSARDWETIKNQISRKVRVIVNLRGNSIQNQFRTLLWLNVTLNRQRKYAHTNYSVSREIM